jgi:hypothetical protein
MTGKFNAAKGLLRYGQIIEDRRRDFLMGTLGNDWSGLDTECSIQISTNPRVTEITVAYLYWHYMRIRPES